MTAGPKEIINSFYESSEFPPRLNEAAQLAMREFFAEQNMETIFGLVAVADGKPCETKLLLTRDGQAEGKLKTDGAILGPYFLGEDYYPDGIAIWAPKTQPREA